MRLNIVHGLEIERFSTDNHLSLIFRIQTEALKSIHDFLHEMDLVQLMPVILSPITDPLTHPVHDVRISYLGQELQLTKSMIFHKQIAIATLGVKGIYIMSPNVRFELGALEESEKHLLEFTQLDIELQGATAPEFMLLMENLIIHVFSQVKESCEKELDVLDVDLCIPSKPFNVYNSWNLREKYGSDFGYKISMREKDPFWITDFEREFYDKEDPHRRGHYINYDLYFPEGFGEVLSGGERDYEYKILLRKIQERNQDPTHFEHYLEYAKQGLLVPSAGGGLGIERMIRFLTKKKLIKDITLFPKVPGTRIVL